MPPIAPHAPTTPASNRGGLAALSLATMLASLGTSIANVGLPSLATAFEASFQQVQWVVLAYLLTITTLVVSAGQIGDTIGRRRLLLIGIALFTVASAGCALAPSLWLLLAARVLQGVGAAILMGLTMAFVSETVPKARIGRAMGLLGTMSATGTALGPALGGFLIGAIGWSALFWVMVPIGGLTFALALTYLPPPPPRSQSHRKGFDGMGSGLLALTLGAYALSTTIGQGRLTPTSFVLLLGAAVGGGLFIWVERRTPRPLFDMVALGRIGASGLIANGLVSAVMMTTLIVGPFYLGIGLGLPPTQVGLILAAGPLLSAFSGVWAGRLVDHAGSARVGGAGLIAMSVGTLSFAILPNAFGVTGYLAALTILTPGYQLFQAACNTQILEAAPADQRGIITGLLSLSRNLGLITGASLMGAIFARAVGVADIVNAPALSIVVGMRATFLGALAGVCCALLLWGGRVARKKRPLA